MTITALLKKAHDLRIEPREVFLLLSHICKQPYEIILAHPDRRLTPLQYKKISRAITQRARHVPFAYLIGNQPFRSLIFFVNKNVLIPRPETEQLVQLVIDYTRTTPHTIADIGTGSGCIAISLAHELPHANIIATDMSSSALTVAQKNARTNAVPVQFLQGSLLEPLQKKHIHPDIIVANLPYLPQQEIKRPTRCGIAVSPQEWEHIKYEPQRALIGGIRGDELIRRCMKQATKLNPLPRALFFEVAPSYIRSLAKFAQEFFPKYKVDVIQDTFGHNRLLTIKKVP